jgi:hypothetical protein
MRRPDSVITTSSIVSSSDTASQSGGDSVDLHCGPPSVYTISGLYGVAKAPSEASSSASSTTGSNAVHSDVQPLVMGAVKTTFTNGGGGGHRRQASHPGNFDGVNGSGGNGNICVRPSVNSPGTFVTVHHPSLPNRALNYGTSGGNSGSTSTAGHRRSNSYGHHRTLTGTCSLGGLGGHSGGGFLHRRTGSSVIETLQTFACSGEGSRREDSLAQFLENLKKEQQEK